MPTKDNKYGGRLNTARSPHSSRNIDERHESEAQKRGFYGSGPSPISRLGNYELTRKHPREDTNTDGSVKRRRDQEKEYNDKDDDDEHVRVPDDQSNPHPPTEPASYRAREELLERTHGKYPLPQKPAEVSFPKRDRSEHRQASHDVLDPGLGPSHAARSRKSAPVEEGVPGITIDQKLRDLRDTPHSSTIEQSGKPKFSGQLAIVTQANGKLDENSPSTQPGISPRDPRRRQGLDLTLPSQLMAASDPNDHLAGHSLEIKARIEVDAHMKPLEEEERIKQKQHEEELAEKKRRQRQEFEQESEIKRNQKKHDADMARKEAIRKQDEAHEILMAELRRR